MSVVDALLAIGESDLVSATRSSRDAADKQPQDLLPPALLAYLESVSRAGVYSEPSGFEEFIDNGDNPRLYERTITCLAELHHELMPASLLDIGCGDGRVTASVVQPGTRVDLLEPSADLLQSATSRFDEGGMEVAGHQTSIEAFLDNLDSSQSPPPWSLVQSTFALHTIPPAHRREVLAGIRHITDRLVFVDFDVPAFDDRSYDHAAYAVERYELGLREYAAHPNVVSNFLMPVLVGQFDPARQRHTFEQPIAFWCEQLLDAGWSTVRTRAVADYWWAPAVLVEVESRN